MLTADKIFLRRFSLKSKQYGLLHRLHNEYSRKLRHFTLTIPMRLLDKQFTQEPLPPYSEIKSVLFIMDGSGIGDCVMHSIAMRGLKKATQDLRLDVIVTARQYEFVAEYSYIDNIYVLKGSSLLAYTRLGMSLAKNHYDVVLYQRNLFRLRELALLRMLNPRYLLSPNANMKMSIPLQKSNGHSSALYCDMLSKLRIDGNDDSYDIPSKSKYEQSIESFLYNAKINDYIAVNFWGSFRRNTLTESNMCALIENLLSTYPDSQLILLSMPKANVIKTLNKLCDMYPRTYMCDTSSIFESIALIRRSTLVITTDTAIVHIASGLNKPTIAFYANSMKMKRWSPKSSEHKAIAANFEVNELDFKNIDLTL
jgi:ADP-heptose:LPS heptosyltransferase